MFPEASKTKQSQAKKADINNIIKRYKRTGILGDPATIGKRKAIFADCTQVSDFYELQNKIVSANNAFNTLPSDVRNKFNNEPEELIRFLQDDANYEEAVRLGLVDKKEQPVTDGGTPPAEQPAQPAEPSA